MCIVSISGQQDTSMYRQVKYGKFAVDKSTSVSLARVSAAFGPEKRAS